MTECDVWRIRRVEPGTPMPTPAPEYCGGTLRSDDFVCFESHMHTGSTGTGPWYDKLQYFLDNDRDAKMGVRALQTEYFVKMDDLDAAIKALRPVAEKWPGWRTWDNANPETQVRSLPAHIIDPLHYGPGHLRTTLCLPCIHSREPDISSVRTVVQPPELIRTYLFIPHGTRCWRISM